MAPKWFLQNEDSYHPEIDSAPKKSRKSMTGPSASRLSATFSESRPWNFMTSAHSSDRSSTSSRKRLSLFGPRSSTTSSADLFSSSYSSPRDSALTQVSRPEAVAQIDRPESRFSTESKTTVSGPNDNWRSSIFARKRTTRYKASDAKDEPFLKWLRGDSRSSSWKRSFDYDREHESDEACKPHELGMINHITNRY